MDADILARLRALEHQVETMRPFMATAMAGAQPDWLSMGYTVVTANYTAGPENVILVDATSGAVTVTLPPLASMDRSFYYIKKTDSSGNAVTVDGDGSETIDGATTQSLGSQYDWLQIVAGLSEWHIIGQGPANAFGYLCYHHQETSGTNAGNFVNGAWRTREFTTEVYDTGSNGSLASNQITLDAGTYLLWAFAPAYKVDDHVCLWRDVTNSATICRGNSAVAGTDQTESVILGHRFVVSAQTTYELWHYCQTTRNGDGFGHAHGYTDEIYARVYLIKIA